MNNKEDLNAKIMVREQLANYAHEAWSGWMKYLFEKSTLSQDGTVTIPKWAVDRWKYQSATPYSCLTEDMQKSDLDEADIILSIINKEEITTILEFTEEKQG